MTMMMMMMRFWMHLLEINISSEKNTLREKQYSFFHFNKEEEQNVSVSFFRNRSLFSVFCRSAKERYSK